MEKGSNASSMPADEEIAAEELVVGSPAVPTGLRNTADVAPSGMGKS